MGLGFCFDLRLGFYLFRVEMLRLFVCSGLGVQTCLIRSSGAIMALAEASSKEVISLISLLIYLEF
jgi:hypothetical protein